MSIGYATQKDLIHSNPQRRWSQMVSYSNPPPATRTAKTLTNFGITVTSPSGSPPVTENCLTFGGSNYFQMNNTNADWAATSRNATDGGLNGKIWQRLDGQFSYEFSFRSTTGSFPGQLGIFEMGPAGGVAIGMTPSFAFFAISGSSYNFQTSYTFAANTWYTMAYTRYFVGSQGYLACWINGVYQNNQLDNQDWKPSTTSYVPFWGGGQGSTYLTGQMQEIRMSNIARYTVGVNYTVPTTPFVNDGNTILLVNGPAGVVDNNT